MRAFAGAWEGGLQMSRNNFPQELRDKLDLDYATFRQRLSGLTPQAFLARSEEIAVCETLYRRLSGVGDWNEEHLLYLNQFPHPLLTLCRWFRYERRDWGETLQHILWNIYDKQGRENPALKEQEET